jgi:hypothetical protein
MLERSAPSHSPTQSKPISPDNSELSTRIQRFKALITRRRWPSSFGVGGLLLILLGMLWILQPQMPTRRSSTNLQALSPRGKEEFLLKQQEFEHKQLVDERQFRVTVVSLAGTTIATIALFLNHYLGQHNSRLEGKRLTFERFTKAIEQLAGQKGVNDEDDRTIRIGAIYTLERV